MTLSAIIFLPLVIGLVGSFAPRRQVGLIAAAGSVAVLVYAIVLLAGYPSGGSVNAGGGKARIFADIDG